MCLPEFLEKRLKPNQLSALLCARWAEHLAEWRIAQLARSDPDWWKEQRDFINIRLHRAKVEVLLYAQVVASSEIDDTCESVHTWNSATLLTVRLQPPYQAGHYHMLLMHCHHLNALSSTGFLQWTARRLGIRTAVPMTCNVVYGRCSIRVIFII
jgi:hypothetical protein